MVNVLPKETVACRSNYRQNILRGEGKEAIIIIPSIICNASRMLVIDFSRGLSWYLPESRVIIFPIRLILRHKRHQETSGLAPPAILEFNSRGQQGDSCRLKSFVIFGVQQSNHGEVCCPRFSYRIGCCLCSCFHR